MKLIQRTYTFSLLWLIPIMVIGSFFVFFMIKHISHEETDEFLTYEMERLIDYHEKMNDLPDFNKVTEIIPNHWLEKPVFKDTLMLEQGDNEMVPYRELRFSIKHKGEDFTIVLHHLLLGSDDIAEGTLLIIFGLLLITALSIVLMVNVVAGKIWKPFYNTLSILKNFKFNEPEPKFEKTTIEEFETLNTTLKQLLKRITDDYLHNKEFNENASHELQTHLAIIKANTVKLIENNVADTNTETLQKIYAATTKLSQIQKSLLLLSKITNREYSNTTIVNADILATSILDTYIEPIALRNITSEINISPCVLQIDAGLAEILINNLIKNSIKHNINNGFISITLNQNRLLIKNSGLPFNGNPKKLLQRFSKGENGNIGIGLAIVKQICELYNYKIEYTISENIHKIEIIFE